MRSMVSRTRSRITHSMVSAPTSCPSPGPRFLLSLPTASSSGTRCPAGAVVGQLRRMMTPSFHFSTTRPTVPEPEDDPAGGTEGDRHAERVAIRPPQGDQSADERPEDGAKGTADPPLRVHAQDAPIRYSLNSCHIGLAAGTDLYAASLRVAGGRVVRRDVRAVSARGAGGRRDRGRGGVRPPRSPRGAPLETCSPRPGPCCPGIPS